MYPQRAVEPEGERSRAALELWRPEPPPRDITEDDDYVVVDDRADGTLVLVVSAWPSMDGAGRLVFPSFEGARRTVAVDEHDFAPVATAARAAAGAPERETRVGDAFRARGTDGPAGAWRDVVDVTAQARAAAKAALYGAVTVRWETGGSESERDGAT